MSGSISNTLRDERGSPLRGAGEPPSDLVRLFAGAAERAPRRVALRSASSAGERTLDYGGLAGAATRLAGALADRGVRPGDRVAFWLGSGPELAVAWLATLACGAAMVPIHLAYRRREVAHILGDAEPRLAIVGREQVAGFEELDRAERASVESMLVADELAELAGLDGGATARDARLVARVELAPGDLALLLYTSGTTGRSKGAMLSHGNVVAMIHSLHEAWRWRADDALLLTLPLFHLHGLVVGLACALAAGAEVVLEERFDAAHAVARLEHGDATLFFGVPTLYVRLVEELARRDRARPAPPDGALRFPRVRLFVSGSAPLDPETFTAFRAATGVEILERYGMTETGMLLGNPLDGRRRAGTVGRPLPGVEMRLVDEAGAPVAPGGEGEIEVRGPNVFAGYWRAPEKTTESFRTDAHGRRWFRTGDRGRVDPSDGYVSLLGRASELILSGGFNVYPREIEEVLLRLLGVREAAVVGEPHPEFGESPVAFLVVEGELSDDELAAHCRAELARFKLPRRFVRVDALPRNALGKVEKRRLPVAGPGGGAIT